MLILVCTMYHLTASLGVGVGGRGGGGEEGETEKNRVQRCTVRRVCDCAVRVERSVDTWWPGVSSSACCCAWVVAWCTQSAQRVLSASTFRRRLCPPPRGVTGVNTCDVTHCNSSGPGGHGTLQQFKNRGATRHRSRLVT